MTPAAENKPMPGFFDEAVYPTGKSRQLVYHGFSTCGSRPIVSDATGRLRLSLFRYVCSTNKLAAVLPPGTRALLPHSSTGSNRYTGTTTIRDQLTVRKLTLNPYSFLEFFDRVMVSGCLVSSGVDTCSKFSSCPVACRG